MMDFDLKLGFGFNIDEITWVVLQMRIYMVDFLTVSIILIW
jgi:hypothetical protein